MSSQTSYKEQTKLSLVQFLLELPAFIVLLVSALMSKTLLVYVDLLDSFSYIFRIGMVMILSKKLTKDLRYEYNYGIGKVEAIAALICDGIIFLGVLLTLCLSVYSIIFPSKPSDLLIFVVGVKVLDVIADILFYAKQRKILKMNDTTIAKTNTAAALGDLLFDSVALFSFLVIWLLRNNPIGGYISPIVSIFVAIYLLIGCSKRTKVAVDELADKTLPEDIQMKILNIMTKFYDSYSQVISIKSHKMGNKLKIDLHLAFEKETNYEEIVNLKEKMELEFDKQIGNCIINIVVASE